MRIKILSLLFAGLALIILGVGIIDYLVHAWQIILVALPIFSGVFLIGIVIGLIQQKSLEGEYHVRPKRKF